MKPISSQVILRTDFSDHEMWEGIRNAIMAPGTAEYENLQADLGVVADAGYEGIGVNEVVAACGEQVLALIVLVDRVAMTEPDHPVLVVSLHPENQGEHFRSIPSEIVHIETNLSMANMDWADFASSVDRDGVFRGF